MSTLVQVAQQRLQSQGGRLTSQRRLILQTLETMASHPTAEELYMAVSKAHPRINISTVYRTLRWLEQEGLINSRRFDEEQRMERFEPSIPEEHHHFVCQKCKMVIEFEDSNLLAVFRNFENRFNASVEDATLVLYGVCQRCASVEDDDPRVEKHR